MSPYRVTVPCHRTVSPYRGTVPWHRIACPSGPSVTRACRQHTPAGTAGYQPIRYTQARGTVTVHPLFKDGWFWCQIRPKLFSIPGVWEGAERLRGMTLPRDQPSCSLISGAEQGYGQYCRQPLVGPLQYDTRRPGGHLPYMPEWVRKWLWYAGYTAHEARATGSGIRGRVSGDP